MTRSASATARSLKRADSGVALIAVLVGLMVLSAVAMALAISVQTEARIEAADFEAVQAEQLARSGQELASFLEGRGLNRGSDLMAGLPIEAITPGFHYRAQVSSGTMDIYFESDSKIDLSVAPPELLTNFFSLWTGDIAQAENITAAIEDWRDFDDEVRPNGAEKAFYAPSNLAPRNSALGIADAPLIRGIRPDDFQLKFLQSIREAKLRDGLDSYVAFGNVGRAINPNFAPELVLRSVPGLTEANVSSVLLQRNEHIFSTPEDFQSAIGLRADSPAWRYFTFGRNAPATTTIAKLKSNGITRSVRRVTYFFNEVSTVTGLTEAKNAIGRIERNTSE